MPRYPYQMRDTAQYQSMFVPMNLDVINQNLQQSQQRYDQSSANWAATKSKILEEPGLDAKAKADVINEIEGNFNDISKSYNGDLGAASNDILGLIGNYRNHPYFDLNRTAMEKKKLRDAMIAQYGADAIKFKDLPTDLRTIDPMTGEQKWRQATDFEFDIEKKLDYADRVSDIWKNALQNVSRESLPTVSGDGKSIIATKQSGYGQFRQVPNKKDAVFEEYKSTSEYTQQKKALKQFNDMTDAQADAYIQKFVEDIGTSRVAPMSYDVSSMANPNYRGGSGGSNMNFGMFTHMPIGPIAAENTGKDTRSVIDVLKGTNENDQLRATAIGQAIIADPMMKARKDIIVKHLKELGLNPDNYFKHEFAGEVGILPEMNSLDFLADTGKGLKYNKAIRDVLVKEMKEYQQLYTQRANQMIDRGDIPDMQFYTIDTAGATAPMDEDQKTIARKQVNDIEDVINSKIARDSFIFATGPYSDKSPKKLSNDEEFQKSRFKPMGYSYDTRNFWLRLQDSDGAIHHVRVKDPEVATSIANMYGDAKAAEVAKFGQLEFIDNSDKYIIGEKNYSLPNGVKTHKQNGFIYLTRNGKDYTVNDVLAEMDAQAAQLPPEYQQAIQAKKNQFLAVQAARYGVADPYQIYTKPALSSKSEITQSMQ